MLFIKIAWRNIVRNKRRSLITLSAVGFGLGALIFLWSFVEGAHRQMINNFTMMGTADIQIHRQGFHQQPSLEKSIADQNALSTVLKSQKMVRAFSYRLKSVGLVSSANSSSGVLIVGVDPQTEKDISSLPKRIASGQFLDAAPDGIVIGVKLAKLLNVGLNDKVVLMAQAFDGSIASGAFRIKGLIDTGTDEIDNGLVLISLPAAQELLVIPGKISEIAVRVNDIHHSERAARDLKAKINNSDLEILTWEELAPSFKQWIEFDNGFIWFIVVVVMVVVAIGILNTIFMGVLERTREFGILMAIGTKPKQIIRMVTLESVILGFLGSLFGAAVGIFLSLYFGRQGIDLSVFTSALNSLYIDSVIYPVINPVHFSICVVLVLIISCLVSLLPALHAARLRPLEAIRSL